MEWIRFFLTAALVLTGLVFCGIGVYGVFKFEYAANRMHAAAILDTMGISLCLIGLAISAPDFFSAFKIVLVIVFWWLSSPVASHLLCRLEIGTDEQRSEYMTVHLQTLAQEREAAGAQEVADEAENGAENEAEHEAENGAAKENKEGQA